MISVNPTRTTGQYIYISLTSRKLSHINRPSKKKKKDGNCECQRMAGNGRESRAVIPLTIDAIPMHALYRTRKRKRDWFWTLSRSCKPSKIVKSGKRRENNPRKSGKVSDYSQNEVKETHLQQITGTDLKSRVPMSHVLPNINQSLNGK